MLESDGRLLGVGSLSTGVYPAFATDAGPLLAAAMLTARGDTALRETIFSNRFGCAAQFARMGAELDCDGRLLRIHGVPKLHGAALHGTGSAGRCRTGDCCPDCGGGEPDHRGGLHPPRL